MSFGLFSVTAVLVGIAALAVGLWLAQRLRVQHREVEVLTTLFWQAAIEETRARVFVRRFRHWWAWVLLVAIASFLWMLLSRPRTVSWDGTRHIVLIDWSVDDPQVRQRDLTIALQLAPFGRVGGTWPEAAGSLTGIRSGKRRHRANGRWTSAAHDPADAVDRSSGNTA